MNKCPECGHPTLDYLPDRNVDYCRRVVECGYWARQEGTVVPENVVIREYKE